MTQKIQKINPIAKTLRENKYAQKKTKPSKGKGSYKRDKATVRSVDSGDTQEG